MQMHEFMKNKVLLIVAIFVMANLCLVLGGKIIVSKAADRVIEKLQKEYSPSPYGPGVDPDRFNSDTIKKLPSQPLPQPPSPPNPPTPPMAKTYMELRQLPSAVEERTQSLQQMPDVADVWRDDWEKERGFQQ